MKIVCFKCKGKGCYKKPFEGAQFLFAPFTLGYSLTRENIDCEPCNGTGYLED